MATNQGQLFGRLILHDLRKGTTKSDQRIYQDSQKVMIRMEYLFMIELEQFVV